MGLSHIPDFEREAAYRLAYEAVAQIDGLLARKIHCRTRGGGLVTTLDQALPALAAGRLIVPSCNHRVTPEPEGGRKRKKGPKVPVWGVIRG